MDKLSDHSALSVRLSLVPSDGLLACDPAAVSTPPTLFRIEACPIGRPADATGD